MLLSVRNLKTHFFSDNKVAKAVDGISFDIPKGKTLCLVGESGSGKSITSLSIMRLIDKPGKIVGGNIFFENNDILTLSEKEMKNIRGGKISMIFQEPMTSLNPSFTIGFQIMEALKIHNKLSKKELKERAIDSLNLVAIPSPAERLKEYPFKLSGGMRQRVMIAMAMACNPNLLIADEPTTALDVTIQAQVLTLMNNLKEKKNTSILFITHDLGVVAEMADYVAVMYTGKIVEKSAVENIINSPKHPYTEGLLMSLPQKGKTKRKSKLYSIEGNVPSLFNLPEGCSFWPRCPFAKDICKKEKPTLEKITDNHEVACFKVQGKF